MKVRRRSVLLFAPLLGVSCQDSPLEVETPAPQPTATYSRFVPQTAGIPQEIDLSGQYLVELRQAPSGPFFQEVETLGGTVTFSHPVGFAIVKGLSEEAAGNLSRRREVVALEPDWLVRLDPQVSVGAVDPSGQRPSSQADPSAAFFFPRQWNMRTIEADHAWSEGHLGSADVTVAILDTGIDYTYPDLFGRVDLARSASFVELDDLVVGLLYPGRHLITDLEGHGTHVASTVVSNGDVIAGVTSKTTLIGVRICSFVGGCPGSSILAGLLHAADAGADVANLSIEGFFPKNESKGYVGFTNMVMNYVRRQGMIVVAAAGNSGLDLDHDQNTFMVYCSAATVICVSATGPVYGGPTGREGPFLEPDTPAPYTNFGSSAINVAAPGGTRGHFPEGGAFVWAACSQTSYWYPICATGTYVLGLNGSSMATPHVSGVVALVLAEFGYDPSRVRAALQHTADDLGKPGTDPYYGKGRVNAARAVGAK